MATKLGRKELPAGHTSADFEYMGRPARDQGDFGSDVGLADMACVNQIGESNNAKYYHGGVVRSRKTGAWFVYLEWGRMKSALSWNGTFGGGDFQFVACKDERDAREFFAKQLGSKNTKRLTTANIGGKMIPVAKPDEDAYIVQRLATREKGLPDAYKIKDTTGMAPAAIPTKTATPTTTKRAPSRTFHPEVIRLAQALVGGTRSYTRALSAASGVTPTMDAIQEVRDTYVPAALDRIRVIGSDIKRQVSDLDLIALTKLVAAMVPRPIPRGGMTDEEFILSANNILVLQQDLDAFEAALRSESFDVDTARPSVDPDIMMNARLTWLDPHGDRGRWVIGTLNRMTNNRHGYLRGGMRILNVFAIDRPDRDARFLTAVKRVGANRQGRFALRANLQPTSRPDLDGLGDDYGSANVILTQHGTRSVNVSPILSTHFRLPKQLSGVTICGANFGHGVYHAVDYKKATGYTSYERAYWGGGGGGVTGRGAFMFLNDMVMGDAYRAPSTGSWSAPPNGKDSVFGVGGDRGHQLENDEMVIFNPDYTRIRYLVEFTF